MDQIIDTPEKLISALVSLYLSARDTKFPRHNILRGRSHAVSSQFEDLFAHYLSNCMSDNYSFYVDQPISIPGSGLNTQYPDILILRNGVASHLIDIKMDNGWNRNGFDDFLKDKNKLMDKLVSRDIEYNEVLSNKKTRKHAKFSEKITYHIVFATCVNGTNNLIDRVKNIKYKNVKSYVLTGKTHPNEYNMDKNLLLDKIHIHHDEFTRLLKELNS